MHHDIHTTLGDLISIVYQEFMAQYDDPELAATATAASINDTAVSAVIIALWCKLCTATAGKSVISVRVSSGSPAHGITSVVNASLPANNSTVGRPDTNI